MKSSIKITNLKTGKSSAHVDNMVSAENNEAGVMTAIRLNKDGSIRKKSGRKAHVSSSKKEEIRNQFQKQVKIVLPSEEVDDIVLNDEVDEIQQTTDRNESDSLKEKLARSESVIQELRSKLNRVVDQNDWYLEQQARYESLFRSSITSPSKLVNKSNQECENSSIELQSTSKPSTTQGKPTTPATQSSELPDIGGYKLKISKFLGTEEEDYDVWWADLQAYFQLYELTEKAKIALYNAHLGGEARKFIQNKDLSKIDTVENLHQLLRKTFSDKYDWNNVLMNISQRPDEKIRPFSVRLRVAANKCGFGDDQMDNMCVNYLKRSCAPYLKTLIGNCLPNTPYDTIVEHAIQFERSQELDKNQKTPSKRKLDHIDLAEDFSSDTECSKTKLRKEIERQKQDFTNTINQLKDSMASRIARLEHGKAEQVNNIDNLNSCQSFAPRYSNSTSSNPNRYSSNNYRSNSNQSSYNNNSNNNGRNMNSNTKVCLHCAKGTHNFNDCRSATEADRTSIRQLLKEKRFDFNKHHEKVEKFAREKRVRFNMAPLNLDTPDQH